MNEILQGDCVDVLRRMPAESVDCCVTSPPYFGLRDYGVDGQLGLEQTPEEYIEKMTEVFREVKRVLKPEGTLWLNIGDSYNSQPAGNKTPSGFSQTRPSRLSEEGKNGTIKIKKHIVNGIKPKDLIGIPWMLAFSLRADGWYLRQDIIWAKKNCMPESVTDRCTKSHEYIFLMSKSQRYFFDYEAIREEAKAETAERYKDAFMTGKSQEHFRPGGATNTPGMKTLHKQKNILLAEHNNGGGNHTFHERRAEGLPDIEYAVRNKRDVWSVATQPYKEAHFATYPEELIRPCIKAGCPVGGVVLDPFFGSGTTGAVAVQENRNYIGIELNPAYIKLAEKRLSEQQIRMIV